jgi:hypothetical protein
MVIEQTVDIPVDHRLTLDVPREVPAGRVVLRFIPADSGEVVPTIEELKRQAAEKTARRKAEGRKPFAGLDGILQGSAALAGDPVEMTRAWRDGWTIAR